MKIISASDPIAIGSVLVQYPGKEKNITMAIELENQCMLPVTTIKNESDFAAAKKNYNYYAQNILENRSKVYKAVMNGGKVANV